ncbi:CPBP family intramembrane metalloprotease [Spirosoma sordidisoli]|uniref:CPBP family intramembrane metalloprotease n=2 Tax=Spirosoma sordidisoli TaxID=2502893 RepID=A0A4Q2UFV0_9BACT|nr:CPBP family intramembrane metalloprotease [Spirosoma sordidisoli]
MHQNTSKSFDFIYWKKICFLLFLSITNGYLFSWINTSLSIDTNQDSLALLSKKDLFLMIALHAPIIETIVFQYIPIEVTFKYFKRKWLSSIISASFFSIIHTYSISYMCMTFIAGIILSVVYLESLKHNKIAVLYTILFHSVYNMYGFFFVE